MQFQNQNLYGGIPMSPKRLDKIPEVKPLIKIKTPTTLLNPKKVETSLPFSVSKMGGTPNFNLFETWPTCDTCGTPLNFVLQLYKEDFPEFYFPDNASCFILFRCPNYFCEDAFTDQFDLKMFWFYGDPDKTTNNILEQPEITLEEYEPPTAECAFNPEKMEDYPHYAVHGEKWDVFEEKYIDDLDTFDSFMGKYQPQIGTKINGFPNWDEYQDNPVCTCGNTKDFFFQLESEEDESFEWPPYAPLLEEYGKVYFFVCRKCGPKTIETRAETYL
jgi:uncharacterized protein YwqG